MCCVLFIVGILMFGTVTSNGQVELEKEEWEGWLEDGTVINGDYLSEILLKHEEVGQYKWERGAAGRPP